MVVSLLRRRAARTCSVVAMCLAMSACASTGDIANPLNRKLSWFSYLNGDDLRPACKAGADDHLRLVYNADYEEQVRVYNLYITGGEAVLEEEIVAPLTLGQGGRSLSGLLENKTGQTRPGTAAAQDIWQSVIASGALGPTPQGTELMSNQHYWVAVGCYQGAVFFNVWQFPAPHWDRLVFPDVLRRYQVSEMPWPRLRPQLFDHRTEADRFQRYPVFRMSVGAHGFRHLPTSSE